MLDMKFVKRWQNRKLIVPWKKWYCFFCHKPFYLGDCAIYSSTTTGRELEPEPTGWERLFSRFMVFRLEGRLEWVAELPSRRCPHCTKLLPSNMERVRNVSIAVVGDTYAGKTHYIAACIKQLQEGKLGSGGGFVDFLAWDQQVEKQYLHTTLEKLFEANEALPSNLPVDTSKSIDESPNEPLIYKLTLRRSPHSLETINLIIYDSAGEDFANEATAAAYKQFLLHMDAMIYIADPLKMPNISQRIPQDLQPDIPSGPYRPAAYVLVHVRSLLEQIKMPGGAGVSIPVAITLSKADLLEHINPHACFLTTSSYEKGLDLQDINEVHQEVRSLIEEYGDITLLSASEAFPYKGFFAVSATGRSPRSGRFTRVEPKRCLDPLLWILSALRVIEPKPSNTHASAPTPTSDGGRLW